jgi:hypothetical protein
MMAFVRYLARNVSLLNILLAAVVVAILAYALFPLSATKIVYKPRAGKGKQETTAQKTEAAPLPSPADYTVVVENNLFHSDRKTPPEKNEVKELPKPELILYGTLITADLSIAYVDDKKAPYTTPGRGKRLRVLKKGDVISGFILKQIETNRITLSRNEEVMTVSLDTAKAREEVGRAPTPAQPAQRGAAVPAVPSPMARQRGVLPPAGAPSASPMPAAPQRGPIPTVGTVPPAVASGASQPQRQLRIPARQ